jgi:tellurite resistance protein TehA-like permease
MAQPSTRSFKTSVWMILAALGCLIVAVIGFAAHVVALGAAFLAAMIGCGIAAFVMAVRGYEKTKAEVDKIVREQSDLKDRYLRG